MTTKTQSPFVHLCKEEVGGEGTNGPTVAAEARPVPFRRDRGHCYCTNSPGRNPWPRSIVDHRTRPPSLGGKTWPVLFLRVLEAIPQGPLSLSSCRFKEIPTGVNLSASPGGTERAYSGSKLELQGCRSLWSVEGA